MTDNEEIDLDFFSDLFKDVNGFRPRHEVLIPQTIEEYHLEVGRLLDELKILNQSFIEEKQRFIENEHEEALLLHEAFLDKLQEQKEYLHLIPTNFRWE